MPTPSSYPQIDIPNVGIWDFLFARKEKGFQDDKVIFLDPNINRSYTFAQVKKTASDFGKGLQDQWGWQKGDVLGIYSPNSVDYPVVCWGCHFAGGIVSPSNAAYTVDELAFQLRDSGAKGLVTQVSHLKTALAACEKVGIPRKRVCLMGEERVSDGSFRHFTDILNVAAVLHYRRVRVDPAKDLAFLVYSSGTTGHPKGVMLSHRNIVSNVLQVSAGEGPLSPAPAPGRPEGDKILAFLPFYHIYGLTVGLHQSFYRGLTTLVLPKFEIESWCSVVQEHHVTFAYVVPPVVLLLSKHPCVDKYDLSSLRMLNSGAAPLTRELVEAMYARIHVPVKQGYGLSETSPTTHTQPWDVWQSTIGAVGTLLPNLEAMYVSPEGKELPVGETGELWVRGPNVFLGYHNNPEGTKNALTEDGFFKTGDVGYQNKDGAFYITDRVKELIKYKGFQVPPAELEGLLFSHPKVNDAAVVGVWREDLASEVPLAYIVPAQGASPSPALAKNISDWLDQRVAQHKRLRGGVQFLTEIPKSPSGKILRRLLKEKVEPVKARL
ncbi:acetyl-CoA synthetase-like protein [Piedraia hortae CBS 480.64]|uniref:Acetyl-CoA synthetase-like protein n=1 Tax=Piedraia hortae CBS 480.64 TaxID=1314780 RepID=A0A6A7BPL4_9PEZI|nr:acetyl-CoA synthetase-like protein [Piedraia hortae CBS 480.64]